MSSTPPIERDSSGRFVKLETHTPNAPAHDDKVHPVGKLLFGWVEHPRIGMILLVGVIVALFAFILADVIYTDRHDYFHFAEATWFYAIWGLGAFSFAVLAGWPLGKLLRRDEDYYGEADTKPRDVEDGR